MITRRQLVGCPKAADASRLGERRHNVPESDLMRIAVFPKHSGAEQDQGRSRAWFRLNVTGDKLGRARLGRRADKPDFAPGCRASPRAKRLRGAPCRRSGRRDERRAFVSGEPDKEPARLG